ncbi:MAG: hypothetical protein RLZ98_2907 [Pseudomonadota bacterium]|jgi:predicted NAD/FAD-binding protein
MDGQSQFRQRIAIIGSGISGLSAAWLLNSMHDVTLYEKDERAGGHSHTLDVATPSGLQPVDMGFIVYNEVTYPNLTAMFAHLDVPTKASDMSLSISLDDGRLEYGGGRIGQLLAQRSNLVRPRFWSMLGELVRFYRQAPRDLAALRTEGLTLGEYLQRNNFGRAFVEDHLLPMAAAIWSVPNHAVLSFPASSFIRFQENHCLLNLTSRPIWRTVTGGSRTYVDRLVQSLGSGVRTGCAASAVVRQGNHVLVRDRTGRTNTFDQIVMATHPDQALALLDDATDDERRLLGAIRYSRNVAYLHSDIRLMPKRRRAWASWNYIGRSGARADALTVTYWMNLLQGIPEDLPLFVTLNPEAAPPGALTHATKVFEHPVMDIEAQRAQDELWSLQGVRGTWYCGAYFGAGFHEDGLQAGLAVAEALGGVRRPWSVENESGRINVHGADVITARTCSPA